ARMAAGDPPAAVQTSGYDIGEWVERGVLANLSRQARREHWDKAVPKALQRFARHDGKWVAAPVSVGSTNWIWANAAIFEKLDLAPPTSWDELVAALGTIRDAGYVALAHGGQAWQDTVMFEAVVMSVGGPQFYRAAFIDLDPEALGGRRMVEAFGRMAVLRGFVDEAFTGRDWSLASAMVADGKAGMQITGDWAKAQFLDAGLEPAGDILCFRFPATQDAVIFTADQLAMFAVARDRRRAQAAFAASLMSPAVQSAFNAARGTVPARTDVPDDGFDGCARKAMRQIAAADASGALVGSLALGHAAPAPVRDAVLGVVTAHFNGEYDAGRAAEELVKAVAAAQ
ncbi:MAG TPA: ABC transporter substrate-binding protein, partial [Afifellaceae bacterium]|nr:ABC transporter substrate-binding protein [Afifellaceae bacterium]